MEQQKPERRGVLRLQDSKWTGYFIDAPLLPCSRQPEALIKERRDELVKKVRCMIDGYTSNRKDLSEGMKAVDALERLGIGYHFEDEIARFMDVLDDVIESFKEDQNGDFKDALRSDVDALLSLYEAAHLGTSDEDLLSSAAVFTTNCLSSLAKGGQLPEPILEKVQHALTSPTQRRMKRLEAKLYISIYEKDDESNRDILELAKLDFHLLQLMHRDEVKRISLWYKELNHGSTLGKYMRERPVECYFWALGVSYEPQHSKARMMLAKFTKIFALFDETYDSYGTLEELRLFNQAVQSWDEKAALRIGKCFGFVMSLLSKTLEECLADGASPLGIDCTKEIIKELSKCMLQEATWREEGQVPPVGDHLRVTPVTTCYWAMACVSFTGAGAGDGVFAWASSFPKIVENASMVSRVMDDVHGHGRETSNVPNAVDCYVKEHGVTVERAKEALSCLVEDQWRSINQEFLSSSSSSMVPVQLLTSVVNLARVMQSIYRKIDGYAHRVGITDSIESVLDKCVRH